MELLEYLIQLRGGAAAAAEVRGLTGEMNALAASQGRVGASGAAAAAGTTRGAAAMAAMSKVAKVGALALVAVGVEAVKMSINFNHEMLRIRTDAGASTQELANMKKGVLDLASSGASMGQGPMSLAQGLYHLESLGIRGKNALKALALSSQEAAISGANLEQTTTAMGAAMYVGIKGTGNLTTLMGTLNATVGAGNMRFQDLVEALGTGVLPSAKVAGLAIQDVSAALAVATDSGYKASSAAAQMGTAFHFLYAPTTKAKTALAAIHMSGNQMAVDMHKPRGLLVALTDLRDHLSKLPGGMKGVAAAQVLNAILPGGRGRILLTELTMLDRLKGKYDQINKTAGGFTGSVRQQRHDPGTQLKTAEAAAQASLVRLGNVLTPIVLPALTAILHVGTAIIKWLGEAVQWFQRGGTTAKILGGFILALAAGLATLGTMLVLVAAKEGIVTAATLLWNLALDANPISLIIIGITALVAALVYAWTHFKTFRDIVKNVWRVIQTAAQFMWDNFYHPILTALGAAVQWLGGVFNWLWKNVIEPAWTAISGAATTAWGVIQPILSGLGSAFQSAFGIVLQVVNAVLGPINTVVSAVTAVGNAVGSIVNAPSAAPGQVMRGRPAGLPSAHPQAATGHTRSNTGFGRNFAIVPATRTALDTGGGLTIHATFSHPIVMNGREVARVHRRETIKAMAAGA